MFGINLFNMFRFLLVTIFSLIAIFSFAQRVPVLNQIDLPHPYYFRELYLPQFTSGPSSVTWSPDSKQVVYSMKGSLWIQDVGSDKAIQLTDGEGYDYQPDWSPDGNNIVFVRYTGVSCELMILFLKTGIVQNLTNNLAVNLEPQWSPDGTKIAFVSTNKTGHFLLHTAEFSTDKFTSIQCITPDAKSTVKRYYYSVSDHAINPTWSPNGKQIFFISNHEIAHGTGDLVSLDLSTKKINTIQHEETNWRTKPDVSPDGTRILYSSYLGRNWHQLWMIPVNGGYPVPLTYGEYDNTSPRWSPNGEHVAFISNRYGNTSLWIMNAYDGKEQEVKATELQFIRKHSKISISIRDEKGLLIPARISITDSKGKFYAPHTVWIHADDSRYPKQAQYESHYFHTKGVATLALPKEKLTIQVSRGPEYEVITKEIDVTTLQSETIDITLEKINLPSDFGTWQSGDLHVHMNYGGNYRNTPERLAAQAEAENLHYVFNLIVNKEQRIPDVNYFSPVPFKQGNSMVLHAQEFHTSFWGHLGLLNLNDHLIIPDYSGYPNTAVESLFPHNGFIADKAHEQHALVGYVHPFEQSEIFPNQSVTLFNELPVDVALDKVDYYELIGFSDHKASEAVWYQLLNSGFKLPAGAGTDAMANYASLRGPVGTNRVFVKQEGELNEQEFLKNVKAGKGFVTNGPIIGFTVHNKSYGESISLTKKNESLPYTAFLRSPVPIDHFEIIYNGDVLVKHVLTGDKKTIDVKGTLKVKESGWLLLRAWNEQGHPELFDIYPYASTNPIFINSSTPNAKKKTASAYFLQWVTRIETKINELSFRSEREKQSVIIDVQKARDHYLNLSK